MHSRTSSSILAALLVGIVLLAGCAAGDPRFTAEAPAGFWQGLWHGIIAVITLVVSIFSDSVRVYEIDNTGGWYDFGFLLGVLCVWGGGGARGYRRRSARRDDKEWEEIGRQVEAKLKRRIKAWAEAEPDDDWQVIGAKAEDKLKRRLREWAQED